MYNDFVPDVNSSSTVVYPQEISESIRRIWLIDPTDSDDESLEDPPGDPV